MVSVVCTHINKDIRHHSGQNVVDKSTDNAIPGQSKENKISSNVELHFVTN